MITGYTCVEQYDNFTGLYYLRARYMNPSTGTFITMDEYAGSVFEPVSLHKYLYANANPVMNSDPTGYYTLMDCQIATAISNTLNKMLVSNGMGILNGILEMFTTILAGGTQSEIQDSFLRGFFNGFMMGGGYSALSQLAGCIPLLKLMVAAYDGYMAIGNFMAAGEAWQNEDYVAAIYYAVSGAVGLYYAGKTAMQTCFTGDTLVAAENGQKRIDEIEVGDKVWAFNVETGETELKTVTKVYVHSVDEILHLYTDDGDIDTTANHPFYVVGKGWVAAGDLVVGDEVFNLDGTTSVVLGSAIEKLDEPVLVYNLEVEDFHSYFVGCVPVLVHNYNQYDIDKYGRFNNRANQKDNIDGHEFIQNAWLQEHGYILRRGQGISLQNIAIGLAPAQHKLVNTLQSEAGMYAKKYLQSVSWQQNLLDNAYILRQVGVPQSVIDRGIVLSYVFGVTNKL